MVDRIYRMQIDESQKPWRFYRDAVENHWDPQEIDLTKDVERLKEWLSGVQSDEQEILWNDFRGTISMFGAGEQAVTEDLSPLAQQLEDMEDQAFVTTQLYEEAKHTDFFLRYWSEVIHPVEEELGYEKSDPTSDRWFNEDYDELFERNHNAMYSLLEVDDPQPEDFANALSHYHLTIEGILAQTAYYGLTKLYGGDVRGGGFDDLPHLEGLVQGLLKIRKDEGRHVGFGMFKLQQMIEDGRIESEFVNETVGDLMPLLSGVIQGASENEEYMNQLNLERYALSKHQERMKQISTEIPDVDKLTELE